MLAFRNVDASPDDPVEDWPTEAVQAALERGGLSHWRRLVATIRSLAHAPRSPPSCSARVAASYVSLRTSAK